MEATAIGTLLNAPTVDVSAGFSAAGLPIGVQIIDRDHDDFSWMAFAGAWEGTTCWVQRVQPPLLSGK